MKLNGHSNGRPIRLSFEERTWQRVILASTNFEHPDCKLYGEQAIYLYPAWRSYPCFFADVGKRPNKHHRFLKIDPREGFVPRNARWMTLEEWEGLWVMRRKIYYRKRWITPLKLMWEVLDRAREEDHDDFLDTLRSFPREGLDRTTVPFL